MADAAGREWPEEGELVICVVRNVKANGAYVDLEEFGEREGFIFIGEVASGWVKNIRAHVREGQRVVCKVTRVREDRGSVDVSLKAVSQERRRVRIQQWKDEQKAMRLVGLLDERIGDEIVGPQIPQFLEIFGSVHATFEAAAVEEDALLDAGFEGDWIPQFHRMAIENIIPPFVEVEAILEFAAGRGDGVEQIREVLQGLEELADPDEEIFVEARYDGAPRYRITIRAPDYPLAESIWTSVKDAVSKAAEDGAHALITRN